MKKCFACGNEVKDEAIKCQFCHSRIDEHAVKRYQDKKWMADLLKKDPKVFSKITPGKLMCFIIFFVSCIVGYFLGFWVGLLLLAIWSGILFHKNLKKLKQKEA